MSYLQIAFIIVALIAVFALFYQGRGYWAGLTLSAGTVLLLGWLGLPLVPWLILAGIVAAIALVFGRPEIRRPVVSKAVMGFMAKMLPRLGETERTALEAGTVWWDGELFSGTPRWKQLLNFHPKQLSDEEQAFLDGPVEELCRMLDEWQVERDGDLPPEAWEFIKKHKFLGMIIPKEHGGLGFSAIAHSSVVTKISSRSATAAVTVMVPNSLGPAELLLHYGTEDQQKHYLPRLATGDEIPCFALTGPEAGSDAAATQSRGVVCKGEWDGKEVLGMRLNWRKRYITLGPVSTVIGLAFRLLDPDGLLGDEEDIGITCALIPSDLPGIDIGKRHDPMGIPFQNGPNQGHDVFVPLDFIIGGPKMAGEGWRMLMESLAAGRSISLPALSTGAVQLATRVVGAYGTVREQFDTPIGRFEGIEEPLARIGGYAYLLNATRVLTAGAVDAGEKPAVVSAIAKAYMTESMRRVLNDAMDIRAGAAICRGPRNILSRAYQAAPIGITVEGANILTRSMIIYGQGAIRCHPYVQKEMMAVADDDLVAFDRAFFGHVNFVFANIFRALVLGATSARVNQPPVSGPLRRYMQHFTRMSSAFVLLSDVAMGTLGGTLKRREKISGRLADALAWMYLASAAMKKFWDEGQREEDKPLLHYSCRLALFEIQQAMLGILENLPNRPAAWFLRRTIFPFGARLRPPTDEVGGEVARLMLEDREGRERLTADIFIPPADEPGLGRLEAALDKAVDALAVERKIRDAVRAGKLDKAPGDELLDNAVAAGVISETERKIVQQADEIRSEVIQVDAFTPDEYRASRDIPAEGAA